MAGLVKDKPINFMSRWLNFVFRQRRTKETSGEDGVTVILQIVFQVWCNKSYAHFTKMAASFVGILLEWVEFHHNKNYG